MDNNITPNEPVTVSPTTEGSTGTVTTVQPAAEPVAQDVTKTTTDPSPVTETPAADAAPEAQTILAEALKQPESTTDTTEIKPVTDQATETKTPEGQSVEPAPPPVFDAFRLPDGITLEENGTKEFTNLLTNLETKAKVDHAALQEFGQEAVNLYVKELQKAVTDINKIYQDTWMKQVNTWKEETMKDPEIGDKRLDASVEAARSFITTHGGTKEQQQEIRTLMQSSGLGNHKAIIRLFANASRAMAEGKPLAATTPAPTQKSRVKTLYG